MFCQSKVAATVTFCLTELLSDDISFSFDIKQLNIVTLMS